MDYNDNVGIDLHIHSNASDGTFSPAEILALAKELNLGAIAITDHDNINGSKEALSIGIPSSLNFLTGVEISASPPPSFSFSGSLHILGYSIKIDDPILNKTLATLQEARKNRNPGIVDRLNSMGVALSMDELLNEVGGGQIGRPNIASLMVKKGYVESINEAFNKYLGKGKPAYLDKYRIDCSKTIEIILGAGGIPVIAHPFLLKPTDVSALEDFIIILKKMGLKGIEVYYPEHSPHIISQLEDMANRHELLMTGGTDFHGSIKQEIKMGSGRGDFFVPYKLYERLVSFKNTNIKQTDLSIFEQKILYKFNKINILEEALNHSSFVNEQDDANIKDNERFEFLGDAVLNLVVGHILMQRCPELNEGELSRMRAGLVNESQLANIARAIDLGSFLRLGRGEIQTNGCEKNSILADTFEALIAAVYIDGGFDEAFKMIENHFSDLLNFISASMDSHDYKSQIQELVQEIHKIIPQYRVLHESGPAHDKTFNVQVKVREVRTEGIGKSKKMAEQDAARKALEILKNKNL